MNIKKNITSNIFCVFVLLAGLGGCINFEEKEGAEQTASNTETAVNPAAPGFHLNQSDPEAIAIADKVMAASGGRKAWEDTRYISWNFFGLRTLLWDRKENRVRVDFVNQDLSVIYKQDEMSGMVRKDGEILTSPDSVTKYVTMADKIWVNDSYWLFMPFKLKDDGVTLTYVGEDTTANGAQAALLQLTFEDIGYTPQNKYRVWVDKETNLVTQWAYFGNASDEAPAFIMPWKDYQTYGQIKLSGDRGERKITNISVSQQVPEMLFEGFDDPS